VQISSRLICNCWAALIIQCDEQVLADSEDNALRSTAASALARMLRARPALIPVILMKAGLASVWRCIITRDSRLQVQLSTTATWAMHWHAFRCVVNVHFDAAVARVCYQVLTNVFR
jgi:hypothetical protein